MDAAEIAYNSDPTKDAITKLTVWVIGGGVEFGPDDVELVLDALEQARKDCEELVEVTAEQTAACERLVEAASAMKEEFKSAISQRDQAQQSAKDARALLKEASAYLLALGNDSRIIELRARIEAVLEQKP